MISKIDIDIYEELFLDKSVTEKYLGYVPFDWVYSSVKYYADCTLAIPFDLFDKVIVAILLIDDVLSIEQLGEILGMNLIHKPDQQQYKDEAEYDILRIALDNLRDYNMIEIGDTSYSSCKLTKEGRIFAEKGYKFKLDANKPFNLFFDHITKNHLHAKKELESLKGKQIQLITDFDFLDESVMKSIAEVQVPEIHDSKLGSSFINSRIDYSRSNSYILKIAIALVFDVETKQTRFVAFEPAARKENVYFTKFINKNNQEFIKLFKSDIEHSNLIDNELSYLQQINESRGKIEGLITTSPQEAFTILKMSNAAFRFIDQEFFWLNLKQLVSDPLDEIFILIPEVTDFVIAKIRDLAIDKSSPSLFVVFQNPENEILNNKIKELFHLSTKEDNKLFIAVYGVVSKFDCFITTGDSFLSIGESTLEFINNENHFSKSFYQRQVINKDQLPAVYTEIKRTIADDYLKIIEQNVTNISEAEIERDVDKKFILEQYDIFKKTTAFVNTELNDNARDTLFRINKTIDTYIYKLKVHHQKILLEKLLALTQQFDEVKGEKLDDFLKIELSVKALEAESFPDYEEFSQASSALRATLSAEIRRIKNEVLSKTYIIDTNVFIKEPDVISKIDLTKHYVALSLSVIEELDKLKVRPENKVNADKAIKNINSLLRSAKTSKASRVRKQGADLTLLPVELQKKSADNMILSLGLVYRKQNPIILTLDRNFQTKAMMLDIPLITINELLGINEVVKPKPVLKFKTNYRKVFNSMKPDEHGDFRIGDFINLIKTHDPSFNPIKMGYKNDAEFVLSLGDFMVSKNKIYFKLKQR